MAIASYEKSIAEDRVVEQTQLATANFSATLRNSIDARLRAGELLGSRFALQNDFDEEAFRYEAALTRELFKDFQALSWVDESGIIRIVTPMAGNEAALGLDLTQHPLANRALENALEAGRTRATPPLDLTQGGRGFAAYSPIKGPSDQPSFVNMVFRTAPLMSGILEETGMDDFAVKVSDGGRSVFETVGSEPDWSLAQSQNISVGGRIWRVSVTPQPMLALRAGTWLDEIVLIFGCLTAAVAAYLIYQLFRRQEALQASEARLREIANNINDAVWVTDAKFGEIRYANPALGRMFGLGWNDLSAEEGHLAQRLSQSDVAKVRAGVTKIIGNTTIAPNAEFGHIAYPVSKVTGDDGIVRDVYMRFANLENVRGSVDALLGLATDVTPLITAQDELRAANERFFQSQKLEAIGQLTGGVAHDFNNLLYVILANSEILSDALTDPEHREAIVEIIDASVRGRDLTRNMLAFAGQSSLEPTVCDLNAVVLEAKSWISRALPESISIEICLTDDPWPVFVDKTALESAVLNLILNAKDAMEEKGAIQISTLNCHLADDQEFSRDGDSSDGRYVVISVTDEGPGISEDKMKRIFEPFFTTKQVGAGTGLGLSMVQGFIKQSGGFLRVSSAPGSGAKFEIYLPAASVGIG
ncbi:ATP-binding protein [Erythrobacter sp.]|uniref:ATP-binding protein n=1 Tax=Erythrobacter sp. TaxID=1042 RepID=UPI0031204EEB